MREKEKGITVGADDRSAKQFGANTKACENITTLGSEIQSRMDTATKGNTHEQYSGDINLHKDQVLMYQHDLENAAKPTRECKHPIENENKSDRPMKRNKNPPVNPYDIKKEKLAPTAAASTLFELQCLEDCNNHWAKAGFSSSNKTTLAYKAGFKTAADKKRTLNAILEDDNMSDLDRNQSNPGVSSDKKENSNKTEKKPV